LSIQNKHFAVTFFFAIFEENAKMGKQVLTIINKEREEYHGQNSIEN